MFLIVHRNHTSHHGGDTHFTESDSYYYTSEVVIVVRTTFAQIHINSTGCKKENNNYFQPILIHMISFPVSTAGTAELLPFASFVDHSL